MSTFEKLCWDWVVTYQAIDAYVENVDNAELFRFEDLFHGQEKQEHISRLFDFICRWPERTYSYELDDELWSKPVNASRLDKLSKWPDWSEKEARLLNQICCDGLTRKYRYCGESEWRAKLC